MLVRCFEPVRCCVCATTPAFVACVAVLAASGCDVGDAPLAAGPRPRLLTYEPQHNLGLTCEANQASCGFPVNRPLRFEFDRWLHPATADRSAIRVAFLGTDIFVHWDPVYDVVSRSVTYSPEWNWDQGYVFDLQLYGSKEDTWGFQSYDELPLDRTGIPEHILFRVGAPEPRVQVAAIHTACRDALRAFAAAGCTASNCHRSTSACDQGRCRTTPRAGLALDSGAGLLDSLGRLANVTDRAAQSGVVALGVERFGFNMPLIEPGESSLSFLLYRMLLGRDAYRNQAGEFVVRPPTSDELTRARSWFGVTGEMPPKEVGWPRGVSPIELVRTIQDWVEDGATTADCE